jgi:hypothetical protein
MGFGLLALLLLDLLPAVSRGADRPPAGVPDVAVKESDQEDTGRGASCRIVRFVR